MLINIATEDELSELACEKIIAEILPDYRVNIKLRKGGSGYLRKRISNFNQMAQREPVLLLTDLDRGACAPLLIESWRGDLQFHEQLLFRVAEREIEAWILADRDALSDALQINAVRLTDRPDELPDPKRFLLAAARYAPREVRQELVATRGSIASQGIGYNNLLGSFVIGDWSPTRAAALSPSLARCLARVASLSEIEGE